MAIVASNTHSSHSRRTSLAREARTKSITARAKLWPADYQGKEFHGWSTIVSLDGRRVEIRSKKGGRFYAMASGRVVWGSTRQEALLRLVEVL